MSTVNDAVSLALLLLQPEPSALSSDMLRFATITGAFLVVVVVTTYIIWKGLRSNRDNSAAAKVREEFEKSRDTLLLAAQARRAGHESDDAARRAAEVEAKERELLKENVDPQRVIGQTCPLCGLEMMADQELVIDPYSGQGYHFSSFISDWPPGAERPKYVYRYPQAAVVKSTDLVRSF
jgi:hypothetical protein